MSDILSTIDAALARKGLSDAAASRLAVGNPALIKNMRGSQGRYSFDALRALADVLDLECYFGPRADESGAADLAPDLRINEEEFDSVPVVRAHAAAGHGRIEYDPDEAVGHVAFTRRWMLARGIEARSARLVRVEGDSMAPTIPDGALALVEGSRFELEAPGIFAIVQDELVLVKRLVPVPPRRRTGWAATVIVSDNHLYPPETLLGADQQALRIIGRVRACLTTPE